MRKILTRKSVKWGVAIFCALALVGGTIAWQLGGTGGGPAGVIASVDGEEITQEDVEAGVGEMKMMLEMQGQEVTPDMEQGLRQNVLNELISEILLLQEAERKDIEVSQENVDAQWDSLVQRYEGEDELQEALDEHDLTEEELRQDITDQLRVQRFLDKVVEEAMEEREIEITEQDKKDLYEQVEEQNPDLPDFEEMKPELEQNLLQEHEQQILQELVAELQEESNIEIYQE